MECTEYFNPANSVNPVLKLLFSSSQPGHFDLEVFTMNGLSNVIQPHAGTRRRRFRYLATRLAWAAAFLGLLLCLLSSWIYIVTPDQKDERAKVNQGVFDAIEHNSKWKMNSNMLYGYYFKNPHRFPLEALSFILRLGGHRVVDIHQSEKSHLYWLHVEKIEIHNLDTISIKDVRLQRMGNLFLQSDYDGWDVGPDLTPTKPAK